MRDCGGIRAENAAAARKEKAKRRRVRLKRAGCVECDNGSHHAHFTETWLGSPVEFIVVGRGRLSYLNVRYDGRLTSLGDERKLRALAAAIVEALDTP